MDKKELINKIKRTTSVVEFMKLKETILSALEDSPKSKPKTETKEVA